METTPFSKSKWGIDTVHSDISFKIKHLMIANVKGLFDEFEGSIYTTGDDFMSAEVDVWVNPASVNTGNKDRDAHVKGSDFFDAEQFKQISFVANTYENVDSDGSYELWGDLTIKGITKRIKLEVEFGGVIKDPWGNEKAAFSINGKINRKDWGLTWNNALDGGGVMLGEEVTIMCDIQLTKQS